MTNYYNRLCASRRQQVHVSSTLESGVQYTTKSPTLSCSMRAWKLLSLLPRLSVIQKTFFAMPSSSVVSLHTSRYKYGKNRHLSGSGVAPVYTWGNKVSMSKSGLLACALCSLHKKIQAIQYPRDDSQKTWVVLDLSRASKASKSSIYRISCKITHTEHQ